MIRNSTHSCTKDWRVADSDQYILIVPLLEYCIKTRVPQNILHSEIASKHMDRRPKLGKRYEQCDYSYPGILAIGVSNPFNKTYRMVDGAHRLTKMKLETNIVESPYYIITEDEFYDRLISLDELNKLKYQHKVDK